jgi:hypothetical protein
LKNRVKKGGKGQKGTREQREHQSINRTLNDTKKGEQYCCMALIIH